MGTKAPPPWNSEGRVRVLIECQHTDSPAIIAAVIEREGYDVRTCTGPDAGRCDLVEHRHCPLVDGADVVVNLLRDPVEGPRIAEAVAAVRRPPALVVERTRRPTRGDDGGAPPPRATVVEPPVTRSSLVAAIEQSLRDRDERPSWWGDGYP